MRKVFIDTNIVLDHLGDRMPFAADAEVIFNEADAGKLELWISALSITTIYYILRRVNGRTSALNAIRRFRTLVRIASVDAACIDRALALNFSDLEDAVQYESALDANIEVIITRDPGGYKRSSIPVMSPEAFLRTAP